MMKWLAFGSFGFLTALSAGPPSPPEGARLYRSPPESAAYGDYAFLYPRELLVLQDFVYADAARLGPLHVVVLGHRDAEDGDLRFIEINMLRSLSQRHTCADYTACETVDGVVIGTNSEDARFREAFMTVIKTFRRNR